MRCRLAFSVLLSVAGMASVSLPAQSPVHDQQADGRWRVDADKNGPLDVRATSLMLLSLLADRSSWSTGRFSGEVRDGIRFLVIIFKIATLYSPLKIFVPASGVFFLFGAGWYAYTYISQGRFTNMSLLLFTAAAIIFLIGLISEQITALTYSRS